MPHEPSIGHFACTTLSAVRFDRFVSLLLRIANAINRMENVPCVLLPAPAANENVQNRGIALMAIIATMMTTRCALRDADDCDAARTERGGRRERAAKNYTARGEIYLHCLYVYLMFMLVFNYLGI